MSVSNIYGQKSKYRITLDLAVLDAFTPYQIDWDKVLDMQDNETVESVIEDLNIPVSW